MNRIIITTALLGGALLLGACARETGGGGLHSQFGQAVAVNTVQQVAYKDGNEYLLALNRLFVAEAEPVVTFAFNSAALDATARRALDGQAAWLRANPEVRMTVTGHTDAVGPEGYNDRLGLRRARAVIGYLSRRGVSRSRLDALESRGETELVVDTPNRERRNRRTVTAVAGFVKNFVGTGLAGVKAEAIYRPYKRNEIEPTTATTADVESN
jgi:peptidoglycan-associated lipoprotein